MKEYKYTLENEVTGMTLTRRIHAKSLEHAEAHVAWLATCFGKSTKVVKVQPVKEKPNGKEVQS